METVVLLILAGVCAVFAFRMFSMVISYDIMTAKHNKEDKEKNKKFEKIAYGVKNKDEHERAKSSSGGVFVEDNEDESDVDRQNREYGDYYGDSYYWSKRR